MVAATPQTWGWGSSSWRVSVQLNTCLHVCVLMLKAYSTLMVFYFMRLLKLTIWSLFCRIRGYPLSRCRGRGTRHPTRAHGRLRSRWGPGPSSTGCRRPGLHRPPGAVWGSKETVAWKGLSGARLILSMKHSDFNCCYCSGRRRYPKGMIIYSFKKLYVCVYICISLSVP